MALTRRGNERMDMAQLPNVWGQGQLFAYSGMDGPTCATSPMVAHTLGDRLGLRVFFDPAIEVWCQASRGEDPTRKYPRCMPSFDIVMGDAIRLTARFTDGETPVVAFAPVNQDCIAGRTSRRLAVHWSAGPQAHRPLDSGSYAHQTDQGWVALAVRSDGQVVRFALAHDAVNRDEALDKAREGLAADVDGVIDKRRAWCESIELPPRLPGELERTYRKAVTIMRVNTCGPEGQIRHLWTTPDRWPHRWMWLHDSAYHATGHLHHFPDLACSMLSAVFDTQDEDGRVALLMRPDGNFPNISQSPILTWAVRQAYDASGDRGWLDDIYPRVEAYLAYFMKTRRFGDTGLHRWLHSDESMDNNPRFDTGSDFGAIDLSCTLCREFEDAAALAEVLGNDEDAHRWKGLRQSSADAINAQLWDEASGQYGDLMPDGSLSVLSTCVTFLPLFAGVVPADRAERLRRLLLDPLRFWRPVPVPTVAANESTFYPDMWRGPSWINMNFLISEGFARAGFAEEAVEILRRSIAVVDRWYHHTGCIYEFYDSEDAIPPFAIDRKSRIAYGGGFVDISDYHWTAALFVAMCRRLYAS